MNYEGLDLDFFKIGVNMVETSKSGVGFVRRYLRHVLTRGLRALRYYG